jgi:hypothetical protein
MRRIHSIPRYAPIHDLPLISTPSRQCRANPYLKQVLYSVTPCHPASPIHAVNVCISVCRTRSMPLLALPLIEVSRAEVFNLRGSYGRDLLPSLLANSPLFSFPLPVLTSIINLPTTRIHGLEQLIHLLVTHLLPQIRQNIPQLTNPNKPRHIFIKDLKAATVFLWFTRVPEAAWAVEDFGEGLEINYSNHPILTSTLLRMDVDIGK